jgi:hypothetical protein
MIKPLEVGLEFLWTHNDTAVHSARSNFSEIEPAGRHLGENGYDE